MHNIDLIAKVRLDSLSKHDGMTRKYGRQPLDTCRQVIVNRKHNVNTIQVVFEEHDGYGHGLNVHPELIGEINESHIRDATVVCGRCNGAGKLTLHGVDCAECGGTGRLPS